MRNVYGIIIEDCPPDGWSVSAVYRMRQEIASPVCVYCGGEDAGSVDHWIPKARGGRDHGSNYVRACLRCNHRKNKKTGEEFIAWLISKGELVP